jgi:hypothetical protein
MLKRTCTLFYGKRESRAVALATAAFRAGDRDTANALHQDVIASMERRYRGFELRGRRKSCRSAGGRR